MLKSLKLKIIRWSIKTVKELDDYDLKREILTEAVKHLYCVISADEILRQNKNGVWNYKDRPLTEGEITQLQNDATNLKNMKLWNVIQQDIKYQVGKKMWEEGRCKDDFLWGQLLTFLNDIIQTRINKI